MAIDWSRSEVEALVADYLGMLDAELRGTQYNKTEHRRALSRSLSNRSDGSIERKHQNVSAILIEMGYPYINGYKPLSNYQALLYEIVAHRLGLDRQLTATVQDAVQASVVVDLPTDLLSRWELPPEPQVRETYPALRERPPRVGSSTNWLQIEARNASLGRAGEEFVLRFERERLLAAGEGNLADRVEHVSQTIGDGEGFDILSFEASGDERLIEVKTTAYGKQVPFFVSKNEVSVSQKRSSTYHLYRLFRFREDPRLYGLQGALDKTCTLDAVQFSARVR